MNESCFMNQIFFLRQLRLFELCPRIEELEAEKDELKAAGNQTGIKPSEMWQQNQQYLAEINQLKKSNLQLTKENEKLKNATAAPVK